MPRGRIRASSLANFMNELYSKYAIKCATALDDSILTTTGELGTFVPFLKNRSNFSKITWVIAQVSLNG